MISVVIPAFNEASNLRALRDKLREVFDALPRETFECVIVDDGSKDDTARILSELRAEDDRFHWVRLLKNSGSHEAIGCGLKACRGEAAIVLAADLQDPPEVFKELIARWRAGTRVVWAVRTARPGESFLNQLASRTYYWVMNRLLASPFPSMGADFFLADREVIEELRKRYSHHGPNVLFQVSSLGFESAAIGYVKQKRHSGKSKWGLKKRVYLFVDSVLEFSSAGLRWFVAALSAGTAVFLLYNGAPAAVAGLSALLGLAFLVWRLRVVLKDRPAIEHETSLPAAASAELKSKRSL